MAACIERTGPLRTDQSFDRVETWKTTAATIDLLRNLKF